MYDKIRFDSLLINGTPYKAVFFHKPEEPYGYLSNWQPSNFTVDGTQYSSAEQYIMYRKCTLFGDMSSAKQVLATDDPETQQAIAKKAKNYNDVVWSGIRQVVAVRALMAKFSQNETLKKALLATEDAFLVECAVKDRIWACGISLYSDDKKDISKWLGKNILGFALMEVRSMLASLETDPKSAKKLTSFTSIHATQGDITKLACDCIVNAANKSLLGGGGVDGAIHRAAGPRLVQECYTLGGCETGEAKITKGYDLPAKWVIHTVGPIYSGDDAQDAVLLANCYRNSLSLARQYDIHSIAFPAISTGVYGYPLAKATEVAIETVRKWLAQNEDYDIDITFCCFDKLTFNTYQLFMGLI